MIKSVIAFVPHELDFLAVQSFSKLVIGSCTIAEEYRLWDDMRCQSSDKIIAGRLCSVYTSCNEIVVSICCNANAI